MALEHLDLLGGAPVTPPGGMAAAVSSGVDRAGREDDPDALKEIEDVQRTWEEYNSAREFDKHQRRQYTKDRKYAAGTVELNWASDANMIGAIIDILVSYLYAKDPSYEATPAKRVVPKTNLAQVPPVNPAVLGSDLAPPMPGAAPGAPGPASIPPPALPVAGLPAPAAAGMAPVPGAPGAASGQSQDQLDSEAFAETLTLVINRLWKDAALKRKARRWVRSALSVGVGWLKALFFTEMGEDPQIAGQVRDLKASLAKLQALQKELSFDGFASAAERDNKISEIEQTIQGMGPKLEKVMRQGLHIDFVPAEQMTVSLDVASTEDYLEAGWLAEDIYIPKSQLLERFPRLTQQEVAQTSSYFQRKTTAQDTSTQSPDHEVGTEGMYAKGLPDLASGQRGMDYAKVVELWDMRTGLIKTMVDGVKRWAREPYSPPQTTTRFYPHFRLAFYEVDGQRHSQSLSWRLHKLQDEYSAARSNQRLTRERSVPGILYNKGQLGKDQMRDVQNSVHQEYIGLDPIDSTMPIEKLFAQKAVGTYDPRIFDTTPIVADMAKVSGVQEPQQGAANPEITATQAQIEQSGFRSRTGTDRDTEEDVFRDFAQYCTECALSANGIKPEYAQRIAGPAAFWPAGMDQQDILALVEVDIEAGSTGKPGGDAAREAWATLLPQIKEAQIAIRQFDVTDPPLAMAMRNTLRETIRRLDARVDVEKFIPPSTVPPLMPQPMPAPGEAPGVGTPKKASGTPPGAPIIP
jgi:hypothetical protein